MPTATEIAQSFEDGDNDVDDTTNDVEDTSKDDTTMTSDDNDKSDDDDADKTEDKEPDEPVADKKPETKPDDEEGYFADEEEPETTPIAPELPSAPASFTPEEKYIVDNLPLITVRVILADDTVKTMQVRSAADLPRDMKGIATPYEDKQFDLANAAQETRARELQSYYRQNQTQLQAKEFEAKENKAIREDIAELQRDGEIPKFKAAPGTRAFNDDPAAKVVQDTIDYMNERNAKYLERANNGGMYKRIGFAEAYELMNGVAKTKTDPKDGTARREAAKKLVSRQGGSPDKKSKAPLAGRTIKEVAAEFEDFEG